jgi:ssDNA-binding Zn-finger/Zn-ribbon topoisomerase 1
MSKRKKPPKKAQGRAATVREEKAKCPRCGKKAVLKWRSRRRSLCDACFVKVRHPIEKTGITVRAVLEGVVAIGRGAGPRMALAAMLCSLPIAALAWATDLPAMAIVFLVALVTLLARGTMIDLALAWLDGERPSLGRAFGVGLRAWVGLFAAELFFQLTVLVWLVIGIGVGGILRALSYALIFPLIIDGEARSIDALELSKTRMKGHRWAALGAYLVTTAIWIATALSLQLALHGEIRIDRLLGLDEEALESTGDLRTAIEFLLAPVIDLPIALTSIVLHAKLRHPEHRGAPQPDVPDDAPKDDAA